jgi:hypothetical protein
MKVLSTPTAPLGTDGASAGGLTAPSRSSQAALETVQELHWKLRIAFLWLVLAVGMSAVMVLTIMEPGVISQAIAGKLPNGEDITATITIMFALFWLIPLTMAFLTLAVDASIGRPANLILGVVAGLIWFSDFFEGQGFSGGSVVVGVMVIAGLLISWHAWKWPRQDA